MIRQQASVRLLRARLIGVTSLCELHAVKDAAGSCRSGGAVRLEASRVCGDHAIERPQGLRLLAAFRYVQKSNQ